ncbi:MAG: restriction endonuclease subunit [Streptosporangiaceae bacterium]|nr:restriction endonuclease subunit [Streptosporangiaceae bacterium]
MSEWTETTIGDVATVFDGPHATPKKTEAGPWFLSISSLDKGRLNLAESAHLSEDDFTKWTRRVTPQEGDVLFSYETRLGEAALMPKGIRACLGRRMGILRPKRNVIDPKFLLYAYLGPEFQETITARRIHGATVDRIPLVSLPTWPIQLPKLTEQQAVVSVLGALDDKIAVNERIATVSLELAKTSYLSANPSETRTIGGLAQVFDGPHATPKKVTDGPWFLSISSLQGGLLELSESAHVSEDDFPNWTRRVQPSDGDVLFSYETRLGEAALMPSDIQACLGRRMALLRSTDPQVSGALLLHAFLGNSFQEEIKRRTIHGATVERIPLKELPTWPIVLPPTESLGSLSSALSSFHQAIEHAKRESRTLAALRDTLLPQLMSGRLRVRDAEKIVEDRT